MDTRKEHAYAVDVEWTGNLGQGTESYRAFSRDHTISVPGKPVIPGSSDPAFRGDPARYNPEDLLVSSVSACHMLWYLHLCSDANIVVLEYRDHASGIMEETTNGSGRFIEIVLKPQVLIAPGRNALLAKELHEKAHQMCFVANSVNFPVRCEPSITVKETE